MNNNNILLIVLISISTLINFILFRYVHVFKKTLDSMFNLVQNNVLRDTYNDLNSKYSLLTDEFNKISKKNKELTNKLDKIEEVKRKNKEKIAYNILPGDKCLYPIKLKFGEGKLFDVLYECEVLEISFDRLKVKVIDFETRDKEGSDLKNRTAMIDFLNNKWLLCSECEMIIAQKDRRNAMLENILDG